MLKFCHQKEASLNYTRLNLELHSFVWYFIWHGAYFPCSPLWSLRTPCGPASSWKAASREILSFLHDLLLTSPWFGCTLYTLSVLQEPVEFIMFLAFKPISLFITLLWKFQPSGARGRALADCLKHRTACKIQNDCQGAAKWGFLIRALLLWET